MQLIRACTGFGVIEVRLKIQPTQMWHTKISDYTQANLIKTNEGFWG